MYKHAMKYIICCFLLLQLFAPTDAQELSEKQLDSGYYLGIQGGADAIITGDICAVSGSTDFGLIFSWKQERAKTRTSFHAGFIASCSYNFLDGWLLAGGLQAGLAQAGYIIAGAAWFFTAQEWYIYNALMVPFTELDHKTSSIHSYMVVSYYLPVSLITSSNAGIPSDMLFKKLYIGMRIRLLLYKKPSS